MQFKKKNILTAGLFFWRTLQKKKFLGRNQKRKEFPESSTNEEAQTLINNIEIPVPSQPKRLHHSSKKLQIHPAEKKNEILSSNISTSTGGAKETF